MMGHAEGLERMLERALDQRDELEADKKELLRTIENLEDRIRRKEKEINDANNQLDEEKQELESCNNAYALAQTHVEELESLIDRAIDALHDDFPSRMSKAERILRKAREGK